MAKIYKGDIGTVIIVDTGVDLTTATKCALKIKKPDKTTTEWVGEQSDTTKIKYTIIEGDLDQAGKYRVQSYVEFADWEGSGETTYFRVYDVFK